MKNLLLFIFVFTTALASAQIKGKSSNDPVTSKSGQIYEKNGVIILDQPSSEDGYVYVYKFKSSMSFGNIMKTAKNVRDVKNMNTSNLQGVSNAIKTTKNIANDELLTTSVSMGLQNKVVSERYREEHVMDDSYADREYKIKSFKIYTDDETGEQVVHAIAKGKGGKIAILLDAAEENGEIK